MKHKQNHRRSNMIDDIVDKYLNESNDPKFPSGYDVKRIPLKKAEYISSTNTDNILDTWQIYNRKNKYIGQVSLIKRGSKQLWVALNNNGMIEMEEFTEKEVINTMLHFEKVKKLDENVNEEKSLADTPEGRRIWKDGVEAGKEFELSGGRKEAKEPKNPIKPQGSVKWSYWNQSFEAGRSLGIAEMAKKSRR